MELSDVDKALVMLRGVGHFRAAFGNPAFQAQIAAYPASASVSPHLFRPVAVPDICIA